MRTLLISILMLTGCAGVQLPKESISAEPELLFNGYSKSNVNCWRCHNGDGAGSGRGPSLAKRVPKHSEAEIASVIRDGEKRMPSFKEKLTDDEIGQLAAWLKSRFQ